MDVTGQIAKPAKDAGFCHDTGDQQEHTQEDQPVAYRILHDVCILARHTPQPHACERPGENMIDLDVATNDNERLALGIFKAMEDGTLPQALETLCSADFEWANSGLPTLHGRQAVLDHMAQGGFAAVVPILKDMTAFSADLLHIASRDNVVFTERIDHHWDAQGRDLMTPHIAGVIEIRDGKICALRDFYDAVCYQQEPLERVEPAESA